MSCVVSLVLGVSVLAVIAEVHVAETHREVACSISGPRKKVNDLLTKLRDEVAKAIDSGNEALKAAENNLNEVADKIRSEAKEEMESIGSGFKDEVDKLRNDAKPVNIDECLIGRENKLANLPNKLSHDMDRCITNNMKQWMKYVEDELKQVEKNVGDIDNIESEIKECGHGVKGTKCIVKQTVNIEENITNLPAKIQENVSNRVLLINKLQSEFEKCATSKINELQNKGDEILENINDCVREKITRHG